MADEKTLEVNRIEKKYLISVSVAKKTATLLSSTLLSDDHNLTDGYIVRSVYFDSPLNDNYHDKVAGLFDRKVYRLRTYGDNGIVKLECKIKNGDWQKKKSLSLTREEAEKLINGDFSFLMDRNEDALQFYVAFSRGLRPSSLVQYRRLAFRTPVGDTRITIDTDIRTSESGFELFNECLSPQIVYSDTAVLEVKSNEALDKATRKLIRRCCSTRVAYSKYANSRNLLNL